MASDKAVLRMFGETRKDSKSQNTKMEGDNDNAAGFRMHSIGKEPMFATCGEIHWRIIARSFGVYKTRIFDWSVLEHKHRGREYTA